MSISNLALGYFPRTLLDDNDQPRQNQEIRIYRKGNTTTARAIDAVLDPSHAVTTS